VNLIVWEEKYSVHVARFDEEHKQLVRLLNSLIRAVVEKRTGEVISPILN
jgi:hemerythrin